MPRIKRSPRIDYSRKVRGQFVVSEIDALRAITKAASIIFHRSKDEAARRQAGVIMNHTLTLKDQIEAGVHTNPRQVADGSPMGIGDTIESIPREGKAMGTMHEIRYEHFDDGKAYKHEFATGVRLYAMPDGSLHIWHPSRRLWEDM